MLSTGTEQIRISTQSIPLSREERILGLKEQLPPDVEPYTDKYFLRSLEILEREGLNPWATGQVMIRKGPGEAHGIDEAIAILEKWGKISEHGGEIRALPEGASYAPLETLLTIHAPIQCFIALETMYLGVLSAGTTSHNSPQQSVDEREVEARMRAVVNVAEGRPVIYMGARHWRFDEDERISAAAFRGGAASCSTDVGAATVGALGVGTIPHVLENIMAWRYGKERAVVEAIKAFDRHIDPSVPRVALIDYDNREITRAIECAEALRSVGSRLSAVRVDTCGENLMEGGISSPSSPRCDEWRKEGIPLPTTNDPDAAYWYGNGVTVSGVIALRKALDAAGFPDVQIVLSSGFGDPKKVAAFVKAEKLFGRKLFDALGVGGVFDSWHAKMDIVMVGESSDKMQLISKTGRGHRPNPRLKPIWQS